MSNMIVDRNYQHPMMKDTQGRKSGLSANSDLVRADLEKSDGIQWPPNCPGDHYSDDHADGEHRDGDDVGVD